MVAAGAADFLDGIELREGTTTVVWHSVMWQYLGPAEQARVAARLDELGAQASDRAGFAHLALEPRRRSPGAAHEFLVVLTHLAGRRRAGARAARRRTASPPPGRYREGMSTHEQYSDIPRGQVVGTYDTYVEAQRAVDFLSDEQFPVQHVSIVGSDLKMVENVLGRLTRGRAAMAGAASGAWFGLFVGVLLSLFASKNTNGFGLVIAALLYGAVFGAIFGFVGHALSGGKRDFTSRSKIVASSYDVHCTWAEADKAREVLARMSATS